MTFFGRTTGLFALVGLLGACETGFLDREAPAAAIDSSPARDIPQDRPVALLADGTKYIEHEIVVRPAANVGVDALRAAVERMGRRIEGAKTLVARELGVYRIVLPDDVL